LLATVATELFSSHKLFQAVTPVTFKLDRVSQITMPNFCIKGHFIQKSSHITHTYKQQIGCIIWLATNGSDSYRLADRCLSRGRWRRCRRLRPFAAGWTSSVRFWCNWDDSSTGEHPTAACLYRCRSSEQWCCMKTSTCGVWVAAWCSFGVLATQLSSLGFITLWSILPDASISKILSRFPHGVQGADVGFVPLWASFTLATTQQKNRIATTNEQTYHKNLIIIRTLV